MISTHILDTCTGSPAANVKVNLEKLVGAEWNSIDSQMTNSDGRIAFQCAYEVGIYRLTFHTDAYFQSLQQEHFFLDTPVVFKVSNIQRKYHVPLLLNPYGFSTYRGS